ncbi:recombination-associated protein RdgC [Vibrio sp. PNB22_3_1]
MIKHVALFRGCHPIDLDREGLNALLYRARFKPCRGLETRSIGWIQLMGSENYFEQIDDAILLRYRRRRRSVPPDVIEKHLEKLRQKLLVEGRAVNRVQLKKLREDVVAKLLKRAFPRDKEFSVVIYPAAGWVVVEARTWSLAEEVISLLRRTLGHLSVVPVSTEQSPSVCMTRWARDFRLSGEKFHIKDELELNSVVQAGSRMRVVKCNLQDHAVHQLVLCEHHSVRRLMLGWEDRVQCTLASDGLLSRFEWLDEETGKPLKVSIATDADVSMEDKGLAVEVLAFLLNDLHDEMGGLRPIESSELTLGGVVDANACPGVVGES